MAGTPTREPPYAERVLRWVQAQRAAGGAAPGFMHLGYFEPEELVSAPDPVRFARAQARLNDRLLALAGIARGQRVLDVGCGLGGTLASLAARDRALQLYGLDASARLLREARAGSRATFVRGDACALPFAGASFDCVLAIECAFHFRARADFLREAARVLVPGGRLVLSDFVPALGAARPAPRELAALVEGNAPWPDPWCEHGRPVELAVAAGFTLRAREDASARVLPAFEALRARAAGDPVRAAGLDPVDRGTAQLGQLLADGRLCMELLSLARA